MYHVSSNIVLLSMIKKTMESGFIASWNKESGDEFAPGDVLCSIETDKATVDFKAQDDGIIEKILCQGPNAVALAFAVVELPCWWCWWCHYR